MMRPLMYRGKNLLLYADDAIVVVYKPAGLAVQTKKMGEKDLESLLRTWQAGQGAGTYIGVVHRLDQPVEGVMVLARTKEAAAALSAQAAGTDMQKTYVAVTRGVLPKVEGQLTDFLLRDGKTNTSRVVDRKTPGAKKASLDYRILSVQTTEAKQSLVEIHLHTGRHHQIRVQFAHAGTSLVGDNKYGSMSNAVQEAGNGSVCASSQVAENATENLTIAPGRRHGVLKDTPALCACSLTFTHPVTGQRLCVSCRPNNLAFAAFGVDKLPEPGIKYLISCDTGSEEE